MERARNIFRNAQHFVLLNTHLYEEFEMNMPFGGIGTDTSISSLVQILENGQLKVDNRNRPLLISKETNIAFQKPGSYETPKPSEKNALETASYPSSVRHEDSSLDSLLDAGQKFGVTILRDSNPDPNTLQKMRNLYGVNIATKSHQFRKTRGIVLHVVPVTKAPSNETSLIGDRNPLLGEAEVLKIVQQNKLEELKLAQAVDPSAMPGVRLHEQFFSSQEKTALEQGRIKLIQMMDNIKHPSSDSASQNFESALYVYIRDYLDLIQKKAPRGAYIKNYGEYASGDLGSAVTTFSASPRQITKEFVLWFYEFRNKNHRASFESTETQSFLQQALYSNFTRFVQKLLISPSDLLIQNKIELAQTQQGTTMEFRVDFMNGHAISSRMRFGLEHYPQEMQKAKDVVDEFFKNAPPEIKKLSGGADVALTADGKWILFEFNFGGASGTLYAEYYPFEANRIFSYLQGRPTPLIKQLTELHKQSPQMQNAFLMKLKNEKPIWWKPSTDEISQLEWAKELRDAYLNDWGRSANKVDSLKQLRENLRILVSNLGSHGNMDFQRLLETTHDFILRELKK